MYEYDENHKTPAQIVQIENTNRTFGADESLENDEFKPKLKEMTKAVNSLDELLVITDGVKARDALLQWSKHWSDAKLARKWKTSESKIKAARNTLAITKNRQGEIFLEDESNINWPPSSRSGLTRKYTKRQTPDTVTVARTVPKPEPQPEMFIGFQLSLNGVYEANDLLDRLKAIEQLLVTTADDTKFEVIFKVREYYDR